MTGLTIKEAARLIGVSPQTIKGWISMGHLRQALPGPTGRILPDDLYAAQRRAHGGDLVPRWRADPVRAGARLRAVRESLGITQETLSARSGITHERISRLELGLWAARPWTILALSEALGCDPELFVSNEPIGLSTLSTAEAAAALGIRAERVEQWMRLGVLPGTKVSGRWRIPAIAVAELDRSGRLRGVSRRLDG